MGPVESAQPPPSDSAPARPLPSLTGLRFLAAFAVFVFHVFLLADPLDDSVPVNLFADQQVARALAGATREAGVVAVSFFFVLSGFVLTWSARAAEPAAACLRRRLVKIYPSHVAVWAAAMLLFAGTAPAAAWLPNLLLLHAYSPRIEIFEGVNTPAWSLCCELLFYLVFPLLVRPVRRIPPRRLWLFAGLTLTAMAGVAAANALLLPATPRLPTLQVSVPQLWFGYALPPARLPEFVLGMLLARLVIAGRAPRIPLPAAFLVAGAGYVLATLIPSPYDFTLPMAVPICVLVCAAAGSDLRAERSVLNRPAAVRLGEISFGFYLCQGVVLFHGRLRFLGGHTFATPTAAALTLALLAAALAAGTALHRLVELPAMRHLARPRPAPERPEPGKNPAEADTV
jgi:peptidoglycan/LPS O-acetylase OafA/YrhL